MADIKVIYVEDSRSSNNALRQALKSEGLNVVFCGGGFDALDELFEDGADIIVSAAHVSDISGYQLAGLIKSSEIDDLLPVVIFHGDDSKTDAFSMQTSRADRFYTNEQLADSKKVASEIRDMAENARLNGWESSRAKDILASTRGFSTQKAHESFGNLLSGLLLERSVNRFARNLITMVEPRAQFLDAFFAGVARLYQFDLFGLVLADNTTPWAAFAVKDGLPAPSYENAVNKACRELKIENNKLASLETRGQLGEGESNVLNLLQVMHVATEKHGVAALVFGARDKEAFDQDVRGFMSVLKNELKPVLQLLLAKQEIEELHSREAFRAAIDSLTGLYNLEFLVGFLQQQLLFSFRQRLPVGLVIIDVDGFSKINEKQGYEFGDSVLTHIANKLLHITRSSDLLARYGGDQFAVVLPNTDIAGTKVLAEKVRSEVELMGLMVDSGNGKAERTTVSVGCATFNMEDLNPETILREAKNALRSAKNAGRNTIGSLS